MTTAVGNRRGEGGLDPASLHLCAWDDALPDHVGPITVEPCFTDGSEWVLCGPLRFVEGRVHGLMLPREEIRTRAKLGQATWASTSITPEPDHVLVLWPRNLPEADLFNSEHVAVRMADVELPTAHEREILFLPRLKADRVLHRLACAYYEQACLALGRDNLPEAANAVVAAIDAAPSFPQTYLLASQIRLRRRPEDLGFAQAMRELAAQVARVDPAPELAPDLLAFERVGRLTGRSLLRLSEDDIRAAAAGFERLGALPWPVALLDRDRRHWQALAKECRKGRRFGAAHIANDVLLALTKRVIEERPDNTRNHLALVSALDAAGRLDEAAVAAERTLKLPAPDPMPPKEQYDFWSGIADMQRILGRARFLRDADGDPAEPLGQARELLLELLDEATSRRRLYLLDRIAQCELYLGIVRSECAKVESAVKRFQQLIEEGNTGGTAAQHLQLSDAYTWLRNWPAARRALMRFESVRGHSEIITKRYRIIAREEQAPFPPAPEQILEEIIDLCRDHRLAA